MSVYTELQTIIYKLLDQIPGEDATRSGLQNTPDNVAKFLLSEMIQGYYQNSNDIISQSLYEGNASGLIVIKDIPFYSICEQHFIPFFGHVTIGYSPKNGKYLDSSAFNKVVDIYSKRLQSQENFTSVLASAISYSPLKPAGISVHVEAQHLCSAVKGLSKNSTTVSTTISLGSLINDSGYGQEWLNYLNRK